MAERLVIDTCVLVDFLRQESASIQYLTGLLNRGVARIHPVSFVEVLAGVKDRKELLQTARFLSLSKRLAVKGVDFEACILSVARFGLSHGVGWEDCLIAATCLRMELPIVTVNDKHFRIFPGLRVVRPY